MTRLESFAVNHDQHLFRGRGAKNFAEATARPQMVRLIKYPERLTDPLRLSVSRSPSDRPPAPVNVSVTHLRSDSATVSWEVPEGDIIIGFSILQQVPFVTSCLQYVSQQVKVLHCEMTKNK